MISEEVILYPDTGPVFRQSLATSVLYATRVTTLTCVDLDFTEALLDVIGPPDPEANTTIRRLSDYLTFVRDMHPDLALLQGAGVLRTLNQSEPALWEAKNQGLMHTARLTDERVRDGIDEATWEASQAIINRAFDLAVPCLSDIDFVFLVHKAMEGDRDLADFLNSTDHEVILRAGFMFYLLRLSVMVERNGWTPVTGHPAFRDAFYSARSLFLEPDDLGHSLAPRVVSAAQLALTVLERRLPRADDLPLDMVLRLREDRQAELTSFRVALNSLAAEVPDGVSSQMLARHLDNVVATRVDPAVDELRRSLTASRLNAFRTLGRSSTSIASATVSASLALAYGAPLDVAAAAAVLGTVFTSAVDAAIERAQMLRASQWTFLLRLPTR
jgi:hypothetical protein